MQSPLGKECQALRVYYIPGIKASYINPSTLRKTCRPLYLLEKQQDAYQKVNEKLGRKSRQRLQRADCGLHRSTEKSGLHTGCHLRTRCQFNNS